MSFSVDGWDPSYGASLELEGQLEDPPPGSMPAWRCRRTAAARSTPTPRARSPRALLFVDGVRRVEAQIWIDGEGRASAAGAGGGQARRRPARPGAG